MKRLTKPERNYCGRFDLDCLSCEDRYDGCDQDCENAALEALGTIEDILGGSYDLDRLRELVTADREGLILVMKCKKGDRLYSIIDELDESEAIDYDIIIGVTDVGVLIYEDDPMVIRWEEIGKTVFLTYEEAAAVLKARENT